MFAKCTEKEIMGAIAGIAALKCNALVAESGIAASAFGGQTIPSILKDDCFVILNAEGNAYAGQDAQTANSADGSKTYVVTKQKEGYTIDFPPYEVYAQKCAVVGDYFNKGVFILQKEGAKLRVYGIEKGGKLYPFAVSQLNKIMPNGRFSSGTTLPTQQLSFIINDDDVDTTIAYGIIEGLEESVLGRLVVDSKTAASLTAKIVIGNNIGGTTVFGDNAAVELPSGTSVSLTDFEVNENVTAVAVDDGKLKFTASDDVKIEQVKAIAGIWTYGQIVEELS